MEKYIESGLHLQDISSFGQNAGRGNLVGVQTALTAPDYASSDRFLARLDGYLAAAQAEGWLHPDTVVIFPENIGTWLVAAGENTAVHQADTLEEAIKRMVRHNLPRFFWTLLHTKGRNRTADALFRMKADKMAHIYQDTFTRLAQAYGVTIVAGSIFLPQPQWVNGRLQPGPGWLQNVSCLFGADGRAHTQITRKVFPVHDETAFLKPGTAVDLPVYDTPLGRLGVLICADSWFPQHYEVLAAKGVELIAVPNNQGGWHKPWPGYVTDVVPPDVEMADVEHLTEREAWLKYALPGRLPASGAIAGMHVFFHGRLWDQVGDGQTILVREHETVEAPYVEAASLVNMWL